MLYCLNGADINALTVGYCTAPDLFIILYDEVIRDLENLLLTVSQCV